MHKLRRIDMSTKRKTAEPIVVKKNVRYAPHFKIRVLRTDMQPKRNGRNPYAIYKNGLTIAKLLELGVLRADLWWDSVHTKAIEIVQ